MSSSADAHDSPRNAMRRTDGPPRHRRLNPTSTTSGTSSQPKAATLTSLTARSTRSRLGSHSWPVNPTSPVVATKTCDEACALSSSVHYVIAYRVDGDDVLILRVLRGSRDIEALFRD